MASKLEERAFDLLRDRIPGFYVPSLGVFISQWGKLGLGDGKFAYPHGIRVSTDGSVYVADAWNHHIRHSSPPKECSLDNGARGALEEGSL